MSLCETLRTASSNLQLNEKAHEQRINELTESEKFAISNEKIPEQLIHPSIRKREWVKLDEFGYIPKCQTESKYKPSSDLVCGSGARIRPSMDLLFSCLQSRRTALIKALTTDIHQLQSSIQSISDSDSDVCLHGLNNQNWKLAPFPIEPIEQALVGVILPKDTGITQEDWLSLVAERCDAWLLSLAIFGSDGYMPEFQRQLLISMLKDLPTIHQTVTNPLALTKWMALNVTLEIAISNLGQKDKTPEQRINELTKAMPLNEAAISILHPGEEISEQLFHLSLGNDEYEWVKCGEFGLILKPITSSNSGSEHVCGFRPRIRPTADIMFMCLQSRRTGLIKALTTDIHQLQSAIQSFSDSDVFLHGLNDGNWKLAPFPTEPIEQALVGVNLPKDNDIMQEDWLSLVAERCDAWLHSLAIFGSDGCLHEFQRQMLISMINDLPTIHETVTNPLALTKWMVLNETPVIAISNLEVNEKTPEERVNEFFKGMPLNEVAISNLQPNENIREQLLHPFLGNDEYEWAKCGDIGFILKLKTSPKSKPGSEGVCGLGTRIRPTMDILFSCLQSRRTGLIKALTTDIHLLQSAIQPFSDFYVCLHGLNDGNWKLAPFPKEPTEKALVGVFLPKDIGITQEDWLCIVAERCDNWLRSLTIFGSDGHLTKLQMQMLLSMIDDLPSIYDTVTNPLALTKRVVSGLEPRIRRNMKIMFAGLKSRRSALINALTTDIHLLQSAIQSYSGSDVCLHGLSNGIWKVAPFPMEPIQPVLVGVILPKNDEITQEDWLSLVAVRCDAWLFSVASSECATSSLNQALRQKVFKMMNDRPTIFEILKGR